MSQEDGCRRRVLRQCRDVRSALGPKPYADEIECFVPDRQPRSRVLQSLHAVSSQRRRHIVIVIVVAQDAEHAVRRGEWSECLGRWIHVVPITPRDVVAAKDDEIGRFGHQGCHGAGDIVVRDEETAVSVCDEADAESRKRQRQSGDRNGRARNLQVMAFVRVTVRAGTGECAGAGDERALEERAAGDRHRLL